MGQMGLSVGKGFMFDSCWILAHLRDQTVRAESFFPPFAKSFSGFLVEINSQEAYVSERDIRNKNKGGFRNL